MLSYPKLILAFAIFIAFFCSCKKNEPTEVKSEVDHIAGVYTGWEYKASTSLPEADSNIIEITVRKKDASSFEIIYKGRTDAYPKTFKYIGHQYNFIEPGPPYYHTITFLPSEQKMALSITYDDGNGHAGIIRFNGKM